MHIPSWWTQKDEDDIEFEKNLPVLKFAEDIDINSEQSLAWELELELALWEDFDN